MVDEGQFLFIGAFKQIDEGMTKLKYHHFLAPNEIHESKQWSSVTANIQKEKHLDSMCFLLDQWSILDPPTTTKKKNQALS